MTKVKQTKKKGRKGSLDSPWVIPKKFHDWWYISDGKFIYGSKNFTGKYIKLMELK